ncbi:hypothetical protein MYCTH_95224 [Thermothelomyces thermophilus ATCC 42464]|uniref:Uncharacterized protein n=1 Tax=Thermothelomyces thermophilus (strain ATCC 42464 / BCRC 31852 / DSM 1799) TaxID=573729 RepID=G2QH21_THET4|nr:uncharacterized protein MYCTH_95224 [Thermothelomyces thermophilus ATCC 42464]AEO58681.1 hypothetical protein MYCTH_95224 [Thermothelomyces thermophilus ATCC 42464]
MTKKKESSSCSHYSSRAGRVPEARVAKSSLYGVAGSDRPRLNLLIPKLPSSSVSNTHEFKFKSGAGTGNNVATAHATSGGSRQSQSLRAGRLHYGDVGGTKIPPKDVIVILSDDKSSDATNAAFLVKHKAARPDHGCQHDPRPFAEPCETMSKDDISKCLLHDERDKATSRQERETQQKSDGSYRSASYDHHSNGDQTSSSAYRHLPVPDETGEPTKNDLVRLLYIQEQQASPSVVPDHQSISEPKLADAQY